METKNKNILIIGLIIVAAVALFKVCLTEPEYAETVGNGWDLIIKQTDKIQ